MKKKAKKRVRHVKPVWKNILDPDYREYFITQAQLSRSIRKDGIVHLTLYDECILPLQDKAKKPVVERKIKTKLIMPERALERIVRFLNKVIEDSSKARSSEEAAEKEVGRAVSKEAKEDKAKTTEATSYIR